MKTLVLIRHAKSSWDEPLPDIERPLNKRGRKDAPFMAELISKKNIKPDLFISSPAERALATARYFAAACNYPEIEIKIEKLIYDEGAMSIINMLQNSENSIKTILLFGHNPILTYLASMLYGKAFEDIPTCAVICFDLEIENWTQLNEKSGTLRFFEYPKKY